MKLRPLAARNRLLPPANFGNGAASRPPGSRLPRAQEAVVYGPALSIVQNRSTGRQTMRLTFAGKAGLAPRVLSGLRAPAGPYEDTSAAPAGPAASRTLRSGRGADGLQHPGDAVDEQCSGPRRLRPFDLELTVDLLAERAQRQQQVL